MNPAVNVKLSVIVPVRDLEAHVAGALASLLRNARRDFEFIVVDDGSVDDTSQIIEDFRADLPGLVVVRNETPAGLADARNIGLGRARGTYVTFMDGDDWLAPGYLAELVEAIERLGCDFVRVDHVQAEGRARSVRRAPLAVRDTVLKPRDHILPARWKTMVDYPYAWAGIYRRDLGDLLMFPGHLHTAEDRPWIWRLHQEAGSFAVVSLAGLFYRRMVTGSLTQVGDARQLHFFDAYDIVFDGLPEEFAPKAVQQFCALLVHHLNLRDRLPPRLRARFEERALDAVRRLPADLLAAVRLDPERRDVLYRLLEGR